MSKLPVQLYITAKLQPIHQDGNIVGFETPLGFLNEYSPGKSSFEKKRHTQDHWAYNDWSYANFVVEKHGPEYWIVGNEYGPWNSNHQRPISPFRKLADPQPQVWNNDPLPGFKIINSVTRYSTSNKLWRILDPRQVEFEISTECLERIMSAATILKGGEIDAKCAWEKNKHLLVIT